MIPWSLEESHASEDWDAVNEGAIKLLGKFQGKEKCLRAPDSGGKVTIGDCSKTLDKFKWIFNGGNTRIKAAPAPNRNNKCLKAAEPSVANSEVVLDNCADVSSQKW